MFNFNPSNCSISNKTTCIRKSDLRMQLYIQLCKYLNQDSVKIQFSISGLSQLGFMFVCFCCVLIFLRIFFYIFYHSKAPSFTINQFSSPNTNQERPEQLHILLPLSPAQRSSGHVCEKPKSFYLLNCFRGITLLNQFSWTSNVAQ